MISRIKVSCWMSAADRFNLQVKRTMGCWVWLGARGAVSGRAVIHVNGRQMYAYRYIWENLRGPIPEGMFVCHKCDNPRCVRLSHLFLGTQKDNMSDCNRKGRGNHAVGERVAASKLTRENVIEIRRRYKKGNGESLAREFGVSSPTIRDAANGKYWKHVKDPAS